MRAVDAMFRNTDDPAPRRVVERIAEAGDSSAAFYAALYLGLYDEARGDATASRAWIERALANDAYTASGDYMCAVARVHAARRGFYEGDQR